MVAQAGRSGARWSLEVALWLLMLVGAVSALVVMGTHALSRTGCNGICNEPFVQAALYVLVWGLPVALVAAIVLRVMLRRVLRRTFIVPLVGLIAVCAVFVGSYSALQVGYAPMYDRNDRVSKTSSISSSAVALPATSATGDL